MVVEYDPAPALEKSTLTSYFGVGEKPLWLKTWVEDAIAAVSRVAGEVEPKLTALGVELSSPAVIGAP